MRYKLVHKTQYKYPDVVTSYQSLLCLAPRTLPMQVCQDFRLDISPAPSEIIERVDFYGNTVHYISLHSPHRHLSVVATSIVESITGTIGTHFLPSSISCADARNRLKGDRSLKVSLLEYMIPSPMIQWDSDIHEYARDCFSDEKPLYDCVRALMHKIFIEFDFVPDFTTIHTPTQEVLKAKKGVCQDFSHLAIACLRSFGFPARYVSGYLETVPPPGQRKLQGSDASHAWVSVFVPDYGWCDFDPTNDLVPGERHIVTSWGRDYSDVPPLKGVIFSSGKQSLSVEVDVIPLD